jgi:hypothetical protein
MVTDFTPIPELQFIGFFRQSFAFEQAVPHLKEGTCLRDPVFINVWYSFFSLSHDMV